MQSESTRASTNVRRSETVAVSQQRFTTDHVTEVA
jgi:hypothetical protein